VGRLESGPRLVADRADVYADHRVDWPCWPADGTDRADVVFIHALSGGFCPGGLLYWEGLPGHRPPSVSVALEYYSISRLVNVNIDWQIMSPTNALANSATVEIRCWSTSALYDEITNGWRSFSLHALVPRGYQRSRLATWPSRQRRIKINSVAFRGLISVRINQHATSTTTCTDRLSSSPCPARPGNPAAG